MKSLSLIIALIATSILFMPAFSMQDHGNNCCCDQNACIACHKLMAIEKAGSCGPEMGPATDNAREQFCKLCMESMMPNVCFCKKPMMPHDGWGCEKSMMVCDGNDEQDCCCEESMMVCDGNDYEDSGSVLKIYFEGQDNQMPMAGDDLC